MSVSGGILIIAVSLIRTLTLRILPKQTFLLLWLIVLIRLLIPFAPLFHVPLFPLGAVEAVQTEESVKPADPSVRNASPAPSPSEQRNEMQAERNTRPVQARRTQTANQTALSWNKMWKMIWTAGALTVGAFFLLLYVRGYRKFRRAFPVEHEAAQEWKRAHPLKRKFAVKSFGGMDSPMTYGVFRPVILAPGAPSWWKEAEAKFALEHEYIHMRRFDAAFKFALALALTIHWFNPAVWLFYILANRDMELSCDEAALYRLGGENRGAYARALLAAEERRAGISVPYAGFGANMTKERIVEIMNYRKKSPFCIVIAVLLTLALAACAATGTGTNEQGFQIAGESLDVNGVALRPDGEAARIYENGGMRLLVPLEYDALVEVDIPQDNEEGVLFSVSEKASMEAAKAQDSGDDGAGWLFSIAPVSEERLHEMLCYDMSGAAVFAKDTDGQYYMYYHPTDVRLVRENYNDKESIDQWTALNEWAESVPDSILAENSGLVPEKRGNNAIDMYLARAAYLDGVNYTVSATEYGPMDGSGFDASRYAERLMNGVTFEPADNSETPDGEYIVLSFPDDDIRFDFFRAEGKEHYIRQVWSGDNETLYRAVFENGDHASDTANIMSAWYNALVTVNGGWALDASGFTGEESI